MFAVKHKVTSKTDGFVSYDYPQLLCGGMVEVNSELFRGKRPTTFCTRRIQSSSPSSSSSSSSSSYGYTPVDEWD